MRQWIKRYPDSTVLDLMVAYTASFLHSFIKRRKMSMRDGIAYCKEFRAQALTGRPLARRVTRSSKAERSRSAIRENQRPAGGMREGGS